MRRAVCFALLLAALGVAAPSAPARAFDFPVAYPMSDELLEPGTATPLATTSYTYGYQPADIRSAYAIPSGGKGRVVAVVAAYNHPTAEADLAVYRSRFGITPCTTANGCFRKVNQRGVAGSYPPPDAGWAGEISLDLDMVSAVCQTCRILLVEADSANIDDLGYSVDMAASLGAVAIVNSWGSQEFPEETWFQSHWNHPGVAIAAATGDNGYGVSFPAASSHVIAVGGTRLVRTSSTARGWAESAWPGAGSGCSAYVAKPYWQKDTGCANRPWPTSPSSPIRQPAWPSTTATDPPAARIGT